MKIIIGYLMMLAATVVVAIHSLYSYEEVLVTFALVPLLVFLSLFFFYALRRRNRDGAKRELLDGSASLSKVRRAHLIGFLVVSAIFVFVIFQLFHHAYLPGLAWASSALGGIAGISLAQEFLYNPKFSQGSSGY